MNDCNVRLCFDFFVLMPHVWPMPDPPSCLWVGLDSSRDFFSLSRINIRRQDIFSEYEFCKSMKSLPFHILDWQASTEATKYVWPRDSWAQELHQMEGEGRVQWAMPSGYSLSTCITYKFPPCSPIAPGYHFFSQTPVTKWIREGVEHGLRIQA